MNEIFQWMEHTGLSTAVRQSSWAVMALEAVHLLGLALLGGAALIAGLAAIRGTLRTIPLETFVRELRPLMICGLVLMAASGALIVVSMPRKYYSNAAFQWKMVLLACALASTVAAFRESVKLERARPNRLRVLALQALLFWLGVGFSGRFIGFL